MRRLALLPLLLFFAIPALAASGVQGRVSWRGEVVPGLKIRAYRSIADIPADRAVAVSAPTATDGTYSLDLAPGSYYLTARSYEAKPAAGDYFCYYSGAPVRVGAGAYSKVGFNLIRIPQEAEPTSAASSGISGMITFQDNPLERVYLYVYTDPGDGFKGPGYRIQPVEKGSFKLRLPPGDYWLLARKRAKGGQFGPIETGDYFNYYYGNPVRVAPGAVREVKIETITRLSLFEEEGEPPLNGIEGRIVGPDGQPVAGLCVFAYREPDMTGTPEVFSPRTGVDGTFRLPLPGPGVWYLLARENFGGPAGDGELYGRHGGEKGTPVITGSEATVREVTIHVERKKNP